MSSDQYNIEYKYPYEATTTEPIRYLTWTNRGDGLRDLQFYLPPGSLVTITGEPRNKELYGGRNIQWCHADIAGRQYSFGITPDQYELE